MGRLNGNILIPAILAIVFVIFVVVFMLIGVNIIQALILAGSLFAFFIIIMAFTLVTGVIRLDLSKYRYWYYKEKRGEEDRDKNEP